MPPRGRQVLSPANRIFSGVREVAVADARAFNPSSFPIPHVSSCRFRYARATGRFGGSSEEDKDATKAASAHKKTRRPFARSATG